MSILFENKGLMFPLLEVLGDLAMFQLLLFVRWTEALGILPATENALS